MIGSKCNLKMHVRKSGAQNHLFWRFRNLRATLTAYIYGTKYDVHKRASALQTTRGLLHRLASRAISAVFELLVRCGREQWQVSLRHKSFYLYCRCRRILLFSAVHKYRQAKKQTERRWLQLLGFHRPPFNLYLARVVPTRKQFYRCCRLTAAVFHYSTGLRVGFLFAGNTLSHLNTYLRSWLWRLFTRVKWRKTCLCRD